MVSSLILEPAMIYRTLVAANEAKARLPTSKAFVLSLLTGVFAALGVTFAQAVLVGTDLSGPVRFLSGIAFSTGLILIVLCGAQLWTGDCLILIAVLSRRVSILTMLWDWLLVYFVNMLGCWIFAAFMYGTGIGGYNHTPSGAPDTNYTALGERFCATAIAKATLLPHEMFFRGIFANMCVCLAIIASLAATSVNGKIYAVVLPIALFVTIGFEHTVANQFLFAYATMLGCDARQGLYWLNLVLSAMGNAVGAAILAVLYWFSFIYDAESKATAEDNNDNNGKGTAMVVVATSLTEPSSGSATLEDKPVTFSSQTASPSRH